MLIVLVWFWGLEEVTAPIQDWFYVAELVPVNNKQTCVLRVVEVIVHQSITRLQTKLPLSKIGKFSQDEKAKIYWNDTNNFLRSDELLLYKAVIIKLSDTEVDNLFIEASKLYKDSYFIV